MNPHALIITRSRTDAARIVVEAETREEAERIAWERARDGECLWESDADEITVTAEVER